MESGRIVSLHKIIDEKLINKYFIDINIININKMELMELYQERFLENNIMVKIEKEGNNNIIELIYQEQTYCIIIDDKLKVTNKRYNINDIQLSKLIPGTDYIDIYENIFKFLPILKNYCCGCQKKLELKSDNYITCGDIECAYKMEEIPLHPSEIVNYIKHNQKVTKILLTQAVESVSSSRKLQIFEPYPFFLLNQDVNNPIKRGDMTALLSRETQDKINQMKNFNEIEKQLEKYKKFIDKVENYIVDEEIINEFGVTFYKLIKFVLQSNKSRVELESEVKNKYSIYKFTHELDVENKFKTKSETFLFHGSPIENWYSIIRNGLKITSHTNLMTTGAAYGNGLYFSNDINLSYGYCKMNKQGFIGVYQLYDDISKYKKTGNIFVVNDSNIVLLRYLIHLESNLDSAMGTKLNSYFNGLLQINTKEITTKVNSKGIAKLLKEYTEIQKKKPDELGFEVVIENDDMYKWFVNINHFDDNYAISKDMKKYKINQIKMELIFPTTYPFHPPFVHILNPRFKYQTGHITSEGAICMELLTPSGWTAVQSIESMLVQIKALIIEGDGRLDEQRWNQPYSLEEAKKSFERVARGHGWLK
jgi:ubiquitin-protein ligase